MLQNAQNLRKYKQQGYTVVANDFLFKKTAYNNVILALKSPRIFHAPVVSPPVKKYNWTDTTNML